MRVVLGQESSSRLAHRAATAPALAVLIMLAATCVELPLRAAGGMVTRRLATVLLHFTHVATTSQREELQAIVQDGTATSHERVVAEALLHMEHIVSLADRPRLEALIRDPSAAEGVRTLASIIDGMMHTLTPAERKQVSGLLRRRAWPSCEG
jgi:hypothetical protein